MRHPSYVARQRRHLTGAVLTLLLGLATVLMSPGAAGAATPTAPPDGALCSGPGVSVVVDFHQLGGGVKQACDPSGAGKTASQVFADTGFAVTPVSSFPGAACRVDGQPAAGGCTKMPPANAYWGLYLATKGAWDYAPKGADELKMADGDFVAFSWQATTSSTPPGVAPVAATAAASPTASPTPAGSASSSTTQDSAGLAWWIPALVLVVLVAGVVLVLLRRRGRTP